MATTLETKYKTAFPRVYLDECSPPVIQQDIIHIEQVSKGNPIDIYFLRQSNGDLHLRIFQYEKPIPLSDILPMLENLNIRALEERPYQIKLKNVTIWISDFHIEIQPSEKINIKEVEGIFRDAFINTYQNACENDGFNKLVLVAELSWQEVSVLRAYAKYLHQIRFRFSQQYIEQALVNNSGIAKLLVELFKAKTNPKQKNTVEHVKDLEKDILNALETVKSLDEDRVIRNILHLIQVTLRTNYYQTLKNDKPKSYLSFKLNSQVIRDLPLPAPLYEIFIYSPRFEGIHLRNAKVARGGIRWSDRREDFRTEILGLMKAQVVKNAVIVPSGAKGGFVLKQTAKITDKKALSEEVIACYKLFISGLLDLTDNIKKDKMVPPPRVVCYDDFDPYLVVAADKGTASFSDIANSISKEYDFWLGDAFASGGSVGYDHKKMGITARGAWESIKRHFRELDINIADTEFTVVGIGDMSGDVFGNGLLYTDRSRLVAAFDHRDIFLDPNPNAKASYQERQRLFNLPASSWQDYNPKLISKGGGVYSRSSKSITLSAEVKRLLAVNVDAMAPNDLIRAILMAPVDLLFNGGIGTYVKASTETQADVGDRANEFNRINGNELRCRIVGEGGNLGFTQLGRIEFAMQGGLINTDFIDNSAGVDCSDHEVNIKILLNKEVTEGRLQEQNRNKLLASMTDQVAELVLADNYNQAAVLSYANFAAKHLVGMHQAYIHELELKAKLNRAVEYLPDDKKLLERKAAGVGLTRPELAVLLAYTKIHVKNEILKSDLPEDEYVSKIISTAFPEKIDKTYHKALQKHRLHREIVATQLSNKIVNEAGITFVYRMFSETGAAVADILRAYLITSQVFQTAELQKSIDALQFKIPLMLQYELITHVRKLVYLSSRWFLFRRHTQKGSWESIISHYTKGINELEDVIPDLMGGRTKEYLAALTEQFSNAGASKVLAKKVATIRAMYTALNIIEVATENKFNLVKTANTYFSIGEEFNLLWFRDRIGEDSREGFWDTLARLALRDELDILQRSLTIVIMQFCKNGDNCHQSIQKWMVAHKGAMERWNHLLGIVHSSPTTDYVMFFIALRELSNLIH